MRKIEFLKTVTCDGRTFHAGDVVAADSLALDHVATCLRLQHAQEVPELTPLARGQLLTVPNALGERIAGPTTEEGRAMLAEIERLRAKLTERDEEDDQLAKGDPTIANRRSAIAEIGRLRGVVTARDEDLRRLTAELDKANAEIDRLTKEPAVRPEATQPSAVAGDLAAVAAVDEHPPVPEPKPDAKAKAPVVGPSKPPELKSGGKR